MDGIGETIADLTFFGDDSYITPFHIFFNKIALLDVNFLNFDGVKAGSTVETFRTAVAGWYYTMRLIACMILAVILIYIGIRMAISTIASEKAMYKKMLVDWVTSLALLFLLHYIMLFTFSCNEAIVKAIEAVCEDSNLDEIMITLQAEAFGIQIVQAVAAMALYFAVLWQSLTFLFTYVKRMITIGFLIMIAPLITITYSIDKIGDQKAQALNTWLKEFVYNVLIQPFHCILFAAFTSVAFQLIQSSFFEDTNIAALILAVCCMSFIKEGEKLVQKIFGFGQASSLASMAIGTAVTMKLASTSAKGGKVVGAGAKKLVANSDKLSKVTGKLTNKVGGLTKRFDKFERDETGKIKTDKDNKPILSEYGRKKAHDEALRKTGGYSAGESEESYNARYEANLKNATESIQNKHQRLTRAKDVVTTPARKVKEKVDARREKKLDEYVASHQHLNNTGDPNSKEFREQCQKEMKENSKVRKIGGAVGHVADSAGNFVQEHSDQITQLAVGGLFALMGAAADGGRGATIGYGFGKGVGAGYMENTDKTAQGTAQSMGQASTNMHAGEKGFDQEQHAYAVYAAAQNGEYDKLNEKLDKILDKIQGLDSDQRNGIKRSINMQMIKDPRGLNDHFLIDVLKQYGAANEEGKVDESVFDGVHKYAALLADANYAKSMTTASGTRSLDDVVNLVQQNTFIDQSKIIKKDSSQHNEFFVENRYTQQAEQQPGAPTGTPAGVPTGAPRTVDDVASQNRSEIPDPPSTTD